MKQVTLKIPDAKYPFFMELVNSLGFVKTMEDVKEEGTSKAEIAANIKAGLEEVKLFKKGKLKTTPAKEFLHEL
jgi:hypothetical protein